MAVKQLSDGNSAGVSIGQSSTDLVGFHGATPVARAAIVTNTSGTLGNTNAAVDAIITLLKNKGLMASS